MKDGHRRQGYGGKLLPPHEARVRLKALAERHRASYAELSRIIGRSEGYMARYFADGVPYELADADRRRLARYFGVDEGNLRQLPEQPPQLARERRRARG